MRRFIYRRKRGLNKPAVLNAALQQSANNLKVCSPAGSRMASLLRADLRGLNTGRLIARFTGLIKKVLHRFNLFYNLASQKSV
jgi:hypothetical protein